MPTGLDVGAEERAWNTYSTVDLHELDLLSVLLDKLESVAGALYQLLVPFYSSQIRIILV